VAHDVGDAVGDLDRGERKAASRVEDRKTREEAIGVDRAFEKPFLFCNDGAGAGLAARRGDGEDGSHRERLLRKCFSSIEIPYVTRVGNTCGDRLCRVDGASAAHGEDEVYAVFATQLDSLVDEAEARVRLDAAELVESKAGGCKLLPYQRKKARAFGALPTEVQ